MSKNQRRIQTAKAITNIVTDSLKYTTRPNAYCKLFSAEDEAPFRELEAEWTDRSGQCMKAFLAADISCLSQIDPTYGGKSQFFIDKNNLYTQTLLKTSLSYLISHHIRIDGDSVTTDEMTQIVETLIPDKYLITDPVERFRNYALFHLDDDAAEVICSAIDWPAVFRYSKPGIWGRTICDMLRAIFPEDVFASLLERKDRAIRHLLPKIYSLLRAKLDGTSSPAAPLQAPLNIVAPAAPLRIPMANATPTPDLRPLMPHGASIVSDRRSPLRHDVPLLMRDDSSVPTYRNDISRRPNTGMTLNKLLDHADCAAAIIDMTNVDTLRTLTEHFYGEFTHDDLIFTMSCVLAACDEQRRLTGFGDLLTMMTFFQSFTTCVLEGLCQNDPINDVPEKGSAAEDDNAPDDTPDGANTGSKAGFASISVEDETANSQDQNDVTIEMNIQRRLGPMLRRKARKLSDKYKGSLPGGEYVPESISLWQYVHTMIPTAFPDNRLVIDHNVTEFIQDVGASPEEAFYLAGYIEASRMKEDHSIYSYQTFTNVMEQFEDDAEQPDRQAIEEELRSKFSQDMRRQAADAQKTAQDAQEKHSKAIRSMQHDCDIMRRELTAKDDEIALLKEQLAAAELERDELYLMLPDTQNETEDDTGDLRSPKNPDDKASEYEFPSGLGRDFKVIVFGGSDNWRAEQSRRFPYIRFVDPNTEPDKAAVKNADVVMCNQLVMNHKFFYPIRDAARRSGKSKLYMFKTSGINSSSLRIIEACEDFMRSRDDAE